VSSIEEFLNTHGSEFDAIYLTRYQVARKFIEMIRRLAPQAKIIFNNADLHFLRELRSAMHKKDKAEIAGAMQTRDAELDVMRKVDLTLSYNDTEHAVILSHNLDSTRLAKCPWVVEPVAKIRDFAKREGIAFLGGFAHPPNAEAVEFFVSDVMPELRKAMPGVKFHVYGAQIPPKIADLACEDVVIEGQVDKVATVYDNHRVFVAPLVSGAGIKGKVIGAMAHGIPSVLSQVAAEGTGMRSGHDCLIAESPRDWVKDIAALYRDEALWRKISSGGYELVKEEFSFERGRKLMARAFEAVGIYSIVAEDRSAA